MVLEPAHHHLRQPIGGSGRCEIQQAELLRGQISIRQRKAAKAFEVSPADAELIDLGRAESVRLLNGDAVRCRIGERARER